MENLENKLIGATERGDAKLVKDLIDQGANVDAKDNDGETALIKAARCGHTEIAKMLIYNGANLDMKANDGWTALIKAARYGHTEIAKILMDNGANLDVQSWGCTALTEAADNNCIEIVKMLIDRGADIYLGTAIDVIERRGLMDIGSILVDRIKKGETRAVGELKSKNRIDIRNLDGMTPLMAAAKYGHKSIVKKLLKEGANISIYDKDGMIAPMYAFISGHNEIKDLILEKTKNKFRDEIPENINQVDRNGMTPLMKALKNRKNEVAIYLIMNGADLKAKDKKGNSVLHYLLKNGNIGLIRLCLEYDYPRYYDKKDVLQLLLMRKNNRQDFLRFFSNIDLKETSNEKVIKKFLKGKDYINKKVIKLLSDNGLDKNFAIWLGKDVSSDKSYGMINALIRKDKDVVAEIFNKNVDRVEVFSEKEGGYKIVVREKGKAYKRYICKESETGYVFDEKAKNNNRTWIVKKIRKVKKLIKKVYRRMVMKKMTYEGLKSRNRATPERENAPSMEQGPVRQM